MPRYAIAIGDKIPEKPEDVLSRRARSALTSVRPTKLVTDYSRGWSAIVLDEARKLGIPYIGVMPYEPKDDFYKVSSQYASSNLIFFSSVSDYLENPFKYFEWLEKNIDEVLLFVNPEMQSSNKKLLHVLRKKSIRNLFI
jgi:hypothetical protein